jgi:hypothetical protein
MEGGRRSPEERAAAREARARARDGHDQEPDAPDASAPPGEGGWERPRLDQMRRYGGGPDVYTRRRLVAIGIVAVLVLVLFMMLGGC